MIMKPLKSFVSAILLTCFCAAPLAGFAADQQTQKPKPYTLKTCIVTDEKLGEMGDPYVYVYKGRELKFCCKGCLKDFNKEPAKYIKKLEEAEAKAKKK
jgi:YHS domain-containing protein